MDVRIDEQKNETKESPDTDPQIYSGLMYNRSATKV